MNKTKEFLFILIFFSILHTGQILGQNSIKLIDFSENKLLSTSDSPYTHHVEPTIALSDNGIIFAGWKEAYTHNGGGVRVSFSKSLDNGQTWSTPFNMPHFIPDTGQSDPWLVWDDGSQSLFYTYLEFDLNGPLGKSFSQMTVAKSIDYGETWSKVTATYGVGFADKETMTVSNDGTLYVVYDDINMTSGATYVRLTRSDDGGSTFNEISTIADSISNPIDHLAPYITTDSNDNVYVAWLWFTDGMWGDIYVTSSSDQGQSFSNPVDINQESENGTFETSIDQRPTKGSIPVIRFDPNGRLYAIWAGRYVENGLWDIFIRFSDDQGLTWSERYQVNPNSAGNQWMPDLDIDSQGNVHVVYYDDNGGPSFKPYYRILEFPTTGEPIFSDPMDISNGISTSNTFTRPGDYFTIRLDAQDLPHVVWSDGRNDEMDIYYAHGLTSDDKSETTAKKSSFNFPVLMLLLGIVLINNRKKR